MRLGARGVAARRQGAAGRLSAGTGSKRELRCACMSAPPACLLTALGELHTHPLATASPVMPVVGVLRAQEGKPRVARLPGPHHSLKRRPMLLHDGSTQEGAASHGGRGRREPGKGRSQPKLGAGPQRQGRADGVHPASEPLPVWPATWRAARLVAPE